MFVHYTHACYAAMILYAGPVPGMPPPVRGSAPRGSPRGCPGRHNNSLRGSLVAIPFKAKPRAKGIELLD